MSKAKYFKNVFVADNIPEAIAIALKTMPNLKWHGDPNAIPEISLKDKLAIKLDLVDADIRNDIHTNLDEKEQAYKARSFTHDPI